MSTLDRGNEFFEIVEEIVRNNCKNRNYKMKWEHRELNLLLKREFRRGEGEGFMK